MALTRGAGAADAALLTALRQPGHALLLRHAHAPGVGDPAHFRIGDCATQRNLDQRGRADARAVGARLRQAGIMKAVVYSSEWCRCVETATLLGLGPVQTAPALNSFFARSDEGPGRLAATRALIIDLTARQGGPVVLVTHQVTIAGLTTKDLGSGEGAVVRWTGEALQLVGTVRLAQTD